jgi:hypothetical protein
MLANNERSQTILSQEMAQEMLSAQIDIEDGSLADAYGFGFDLQTDENLGSQALLSHQFTGRL